MVSPAGERLNRIIEEIRAFAELFGFAREEKKAA
jgi:hypothetical protein